MSSPPLFDVWLSLYVMTGIAVFGPFALMGMDRAVTLAVARGWLERAAEHPGAGVDWRDFRFMAAFVFVTGSMAIGAQVLMFRGREIPIDLGVHPIEMVLFTTGLMLLVDANGFFWHLFSHRNRRAYRAFHGGHHRTKHRVHIALAFYSSSLLDYPLHSGIVLSLGLSLIVLVTGHYQVVTILYAITVYVLGVAVTHSGLRETPGMRWALWIILLPIKIVPSAIRLEDHLRHHEEGDCNYAVFFSHWDRLFRTWKPTTAS